MVLPALVTADEESLILIRVEGFGVQGLGMLLADGSMSLRSLEAGFGASRRASAKKSM